MIKFKEIIKGTYGNDIVTYTHFMDIKEIEEFTIRKFDDTYEYEVLLTTKSGTTKTLTSFDNYKDAEDFIEAVTSIRFMGYIIDVDQVKVELKNRRKSNGN